MTQSIFTEDVRFEPWWWEAAPRAPRGEATLPAEVGGVMNHHGDALPVLCRGALLGCDEASLGEPAL